jgi:hypothetical protein
MSLGNFLKNLDHSLYSQYQIDRYVKESAGNVEKPNFDMAKQKPVFNISPIKLPTISSLPATHMARVYCEKRQLPRLEELFYAEDYLQFLNEIFPNHQKKISPQDQRLVIPLYDQQKNLVGVQGRTLTNSPVRYITVKKDEECPKIFGLHKVDLNEEIYIVEGPLDSLFLDNSLATLDSTLSTILNTLGDHEYVFVHDNEPRNPNIIRQIEKSIKTGKKVCIWPNDVIEKDINDMILAGRTPEQIKDIINNNSFQTLRATLELNRWRKM